MKTAIIIPTFNESENIIGLVKEILSIDSNFSVLVVDDNSPDKTYNLIKRFAENNLDIYGPRLNVVLREEKDGRGGAVWHGFSEMVKKDFDIFVEMDADFSHHPKYLIEGVKEIRNGADVVIGARYPKGKIVDWPIKRRLFSRLANFLCRLLISFKIHDFTNGYRFYNKQFISRYSSRNFMFSGYINLSETIALAIKNKLVIKSFPITFVNRKIGSSNTNFLELVTSFTAIFVIAWKYWLDKKFK